MSSPMFTFPTLEKKRKPKFSADDSFEGKGYRKLRNKDNWALDSANQNYH